MKIIRIFETAFGTTVAGDPVSQKTSEYFFRAESIQALAAAMGGKIYDQGGEQRMIIKADELPAGARLESGTRGQGFWKKEYFTLHMNISGKPLYLPAEKHGVSMRVEEVETIPLMRANLPA